MAGATARAAKANATKAKATRNCGWETIHLPIALSLPDIFWASVGIYWRGRYLIAVFILSLVSVIIKNLEELRRSLFTQGEPQTSRKIGILAEPQIVAELVLSSI